MPPSTWGVGDRPGGGDMPFNGGGDMPPSTEEVGDRSNGGGGTEPMAEGTCLHPRGRSGTEDLLLPDLMATYGSKCHSPKDLRLTSRLDER